MDIYSSKFIKKCLLEENITDTLEFCDKKLSNELNRITKEKMKLILLLKINK